MASFFTGGVSNDEAAAAIAGKPAVLRAVFDQLLPELKGLAFTVTGVQDANVLQRMRDRIADLPRGGDWDAIKRDLVKELSPFLVDENAEPEVRDAQIKAAARRAELLLRTHGYQSYAAFNYRQMVESATYLPYWKYLSAYDDQVRDSHRALHGLILPWDHPFWQDHFAPWDWGCRCQVIATTDREYEQALKNPTEHAWTLGPEALKRLADGTLDKGDGHPVNVDSPRLKARRAGRDPNTAYAWKPGEVGIPVEQLKARYDKHTWETVGRIFEQKDTKVKLSRAVTVDGGDTPEPVKTVKRDDAIDRLKAAGVTDISISAEEILPTVTIERLESSIRMVRGWGLPVHPRMTIDGMTARDLGKKSSSRPALVYSPEVDVIFVDPVAVSTITDTDIVTAYQNGRISSPHRFYHYIHEMAHPLHWRRDRASYALGLTVEQQRIAVQYVSRYARRDAAEFVAEVFAALRTDRLFEREASVVLDIYNLLGGPL